MDFQNMKRRQLQSLCKLNNIPANLTNAAMATALSNLSIVEGLEEFLRDPTAGDFGSPNVPTTTRQKVTIEEPEGSNLTTRTRGTRRRAVEATDTRKTPATRTTRKKASEEATIQKQAEKHLQADFEADLEQSEVSDNSGLLGESMEISEEVVNDGQQVFDVVDNKENLENNEDVSKDEEVSTEMYNSNCKVDFHSLSRRDLQGLCKKNKIPANTSNATMAHALESLENVEGLEEFLEESNSQAPRSPTMSEMTSSCARRTWTSRRVSKEPASSKLITKSCRGSRREVIEEIDHENTSAVSQASEAGTIVCCVESVQKKEVLAYSRRVNKASAANQLGNVECSGNVISDEGGLSVVETAEIVNPEVLDFVNTSNGFTQEAASVNNFIESLQNIDSSENDNGKGEYSILATDNVKLLEDSEKKKDGDVDHISFGVSEIPVQLQNTVNEIVVSESKDSQPENGNGSTNAKSSEGSEVSSDAGSENRSEDSELQNANEGTNTESSEDSDLPSDVVSENGPENSEFENLCEGTNTGGLDSEIFTDAAFKCEPLNLFLVEKLDGAQGDQVLEFEPELNTAADEVNNMETENQLINPVVVSSHLAGQLCPVEQTESNHAQGDQVLDNFEPELNTAADEVNNMETENQLINPVVVSSHLAGQLCPVEQTESNHAQGDQVLDKFEPELNTAADEVNNMETENQLINPFVVSSHLAGQLCPVEQTESNHAQGDQVLDKFEPELNTAADEVNNMETENQLINPVVVSSHLAGQLCPVEQTESNHAEEENTSSNDALISHPNEKIEASYADRDTSKEAFSESTIQTKGKKTPLEKKSIRQLKKLLKEKFEETNALAKKLENITLGEKDDSLAKVEESEDLEGVRAEGLEDLIESIDVTVADNLYAVNKILDNSISEDSVTGDIDVEFDREMTNEKHSSITPSKTPVSVARMNHDSDVNKENIDHSASKTKSTKNSVARNGNILSPMSIRMLKKAIGQQHSEKKRPALLARSENCHPMASP